MTTKVTSCTTTSCAFNHDGCTALAITIGGEASMAACGTFIALDARGGLPTAAGQVGACKRLECVHNEDLMCTAPGVAIVDAACTSYQAR